MQGNYIGTDASGTGDLGNSFSGVFISGPDNFVGDASPDARNIISGNDQHGVLISGASGNRVQGNYIGTDANGTAALGNGLGVHISGTNNSIGDVSPDARNVITFNTVRGVWITDSSSTGNSIRSNSIFSNGGLGIDLDPNGVTPNDTGDSDTGPNTLQNFPVVSTATTSSVTGATTIQGSLNSIPNKTFAIQLFSNPTPDPSGNDEGQTYIGQTTATTNGGGDASFTFTPTLAVPPGQVVTATATSPTNDTSEFSAGVAVRSTGVLQFSSATYSVDEAGPSATITVTRSGGDAGPATVDYATGGGTASLGTDYVGVTGTLNFNDGQMSRTFLVPITEDSLDEPDETVGLQLSGATGVALGSPSNATLTINDNDEPPPDTTAPTVTSVTPTEGALKVLRATNVTATFSKAMDASTLTDTTVTLLNTKTGLQEQAVLTVSSDSSNGNTIVTLDPSATKLAKNTKYEVRIKGGSGGAEDLAGNPLGSDKVWSFTTGPK